MIRFINRMISHIVKRTLEIIRDLAIAFGLLKVAGVIV